MDNDHEMLTSARSGLSAQIKARQPDESHAGNASLDTIERRVARLEANLKLGPIEDIPASDMQDQSMEQPLLESPRDIETAFGLTWISRIAVVTIILALAFFFDYAFEHRWITEQGRVLLGTGCGVAALFFGERLWRTGQRAYAQALTAAGVSSFYLSFWAAFGLYHLITQATAFGLTVFVTTAAGALALRYDGSAIAVLGLAGGFATPLLLGSSGEPWFVLGYALALDLGAAFAASRRDWRWPEALAIAGTVVIYVSRAPVAPGQRWVYSLFLFAFYGLFAASRQLRIVAAAQILAGLALVQLWAPDAVGLPAICLVTVVGLVVAGGRNWPTSASICFASFWLAYGLWRVQATGPPRTLESLATITASYLAFAVWLVWRAASGRQPLCIQDLLLVALNAAFYFGAAYSLLLTGYASSEGLFAVAVAGIQIGAACLMWRHDARGSLLAAGAAWVLLCLAAPIQFVGYPITIAWAVEGAAIAWISVRMRDLRASYASLAVFLLVLLRLAWADSSIYPNSASYTALSNARFLAFAVAAASFWAAAWWIRRGRLVWINYVGGHFVLLWGLCLEAAEWVSRSAAPQNVRSVTSIVLSVLVAVYAVALVAGGAARRQVLTRMLGIGLVGLVIVKLYLYDVWWLGRFYRLAAFVLLGGLLLVMSYLYSRLATHGRGHYRIHPGIVERDGGE